VPVDADVVGDGDRPRLVRAALLEPGPVVRHDPDKLGPILRELARDGQSRTGPRPRTGAKTA